MRSEALRTDNGKLCVLASSVRLWSGGALGLMKAMSFMHSSFLAQSTQQNPCAIVHNVPAFVKVLWKLTN